MPAPRVEPRLDWLNLAWKPNNSRYDIRESTNRRRSLERHQWVGELGGTANGGRSLGANSQFSEKSAPKLVTINRADYCRIVVPDSEHQLLIVFGTIPRCRRPNRVGAGTAKRFIFPLWGREKRFIHVPA